MSNDLPSVYGLNSRQMEVLSEIELRKKMKLRLVATEFPDVLRVELMFPRTERLEDAEEVHS
ncbi:MAG TPA: hypothetical protein VEJ19_03095 [Nitrososphaerales archaeon]|nr:hypothetical protein [Nitrososphaerales archaeon]